MYKVGDIVKSVRLDMSKGSVKDVNIETHRILGINDKFIVLDDPLFTKICIKKGKSYNHYTQMDKTIVVDWTMDTYINWDFTINMYSQKSDKVISRSIDKQFKEYVAEKVGPYTQKIDSLALVLGRGHVDV